MARDLSAALATELTSLTLSPIILVKLSFDGGDLNLWSGIGELLFDGDTYTGAGDLLSIAAIDETQGLTANGVQLSLSGIPSSIISAALTEEYQGRPAKVWLGALDDSGTLVVDPYLMFSGFMDVMKHRDEGETATFALSVENELISLERPNVRRYTTQDQSIDGFSDTGFDQVPSLQDAKIIWGN